MLIIGGGIPVQAQTNLGLDNSFTQTNLEFGYQLHPQKFLENTIGTISIHALDNGKITPIPIDGLKVSSSDNTIVEIRDVKNADNYSTGIEILAKEPGCLLYTSPSPRDVEESRMPSSA